MLFVNPVAVLIIDVVHPINYIVVVVVIIVVFVFVVVIVIVVVAAAAAVVVVAVFGWLFDWLCRKV